MQIKIGFSASKSLHSRVVRWITRSSVSHVFFIVENSFLGEDLVLEADPPDVRVRSLRTFQSKNAIVKTVLMPGALQPALSKAVHLLGRPYDYGVFLGKAVVLFGRWLRRKWKNPFNSRRRQDCVEWVITVLQLGGYPGSEELDATLLSPQDLMEFLSPPAK